MSGTIDAPAAPSPEDARTSISLVEATAVQVCLARWHAASIGPGGPAKPLFDGSFDKAIADLALPRAEQELLAKGTSRIQMMAVRTVSIDEKLLSMLAEGAAEGGTPLHQVVILGAGLDCRAWRLAWPTGTVVYEVDSGSVEALKLRSLSRFPLQCKRVFVTADLGVVGDLTNKLGQAGHVSSEPSLWLLEGLIGYLTRPQGTQLFKAMAQLSPPRSRVVMTGPPTHANKKDMLRGDGTRLHHVMREQTQATLKRLCRQGWTGSVRSGQDLGDHYGIDWNYQSQVYAQRAAPRGGRRCAIM